MLWFCWEKWWVGSIAVKYLTDSWVCHHGDILIFSTESWMGHTWVEEKEPVPMYQSPSEALEGFDIFFFYLFIAVKLHCCTRICTYWKCTVWRVLTKVYTHETVTTIKIMNIFTPKFSCPLCQPPTLSSSSHQIAFCHDRLEHIF